MGVLPSPISKKKAPTFRQRTPERRRHLGHGTYASPKRRVCGGREKYARIPAEMRRIRERMSIGNITSPSPGPPASRTRTHRSASPPKEDFVTGILGRGKNRGQALAPQPWRRPRQPLNPSFVFYNIPGSFVNFCNQNPVSRQGSKALGDRKVAPPPNPSSPEEGSS